MLFTMRVTMLSDWHIGLGQSKGDIDSLIQRDSDGLPYIPAKTLTGILRDSCELVALGLDNGNENGVWSQWVNFLFGSQPALEEGAIESSPQPAIISLRSAHFPDSLKNALTVKTKIKDAIAFIKPGISIDNDTGCAKPDFLRFEEMIRKGAILDAKDCQINYPADISEDDLQRPSSDVGGVYSYSAIAPKTTFRGEIRVKSDLFNHLTKQKKEWWRNLEDSYSIGQSKKDDYGTIKVTIAQKPQLYQGKIQLDNNTLSVWLLSDLLLRDERLNPTADLNILKETLETTLGPSVTEVDTSNNPLNVKAINSNDSAFEYARIIETEAWREAIQQKALDLASDRQTRKQYLGLDIQGEESKPPMTQLVALRSVVGKLQSQNDKNQVTNWITALESVPNRKEKWAGNSLKLIRSLINDERKIWEYLHLPNDLTITQNAETDLKRQLWAERGDTHLNRCHDSGA